MRIGLWAHNGVGMITVVAPMLYDATGGMMCSILHELFCFQTYCCPTQRLGANFCCGDDAHPVCINGYLLLGLAA